MPELRIDYATHEGVDELVDTLAYCAEGIGIEFEHWEDAHTKGPGLYFAVVADHDYESYADPMGSNAWPVDACRRVGPRERFFETARVVAFQNDGAAVVSVDGVLQERMVRLRDLDQRGADEVPDIEYEAWMGSRHMSALETSVRETIVATVTLSEETGRVSVFEDGNFRTCERHELGGRWRPAEPPDAPDPDAYGTPSGRPETLVRKRRPPVGSARFRGREPRP
jgi:hypothetical protein